MSMDAPTAAAFAALAKECLPKLHAKLAVLAKLPASQRQPDGELLALTEATRKALDTLATWAGVPAAAPAKPTPAKTPAIIATAQAEGLDSDLSDEEAAALLANMYADAPAEGNSDNDGLGEDPDAAAMLATMENEASADEAGGELSDDEAAAMLAAMDAPAEAPKPVAKPAAKGAPAKLTAAPAPAADLSDEEAAAMLAAMDAPLASETPTGGGDISDDEAAALLAAMDAPAAAPPPKPAAKAAVKLAPAPEPMSADDEAMALLASMGGDDGEAAAAAPEPAPAAHTEEPDGEEEHEELKEIPEFAKNDFASDPEMMTDFSSNTEEIMQTLDAKILELEQNPRDKETIESIFRGAHTLKGAAGMFGFKAIERVMHRMESLFDNVRKGTLVPDPNIIDVVFQGLDVLRTLLEAANKQTPSGIKTVPIVKALEAASKGKYVKGSIGGAAPAKAAEAPAEAAPSEGGGGDDKPAGGTKKKSAEQSTIRVDLERLDALVNLVGELVIDRTRFASIEENIRTTNPQMTVAGNMSETVQLFGRHMNEIYDIIMKIRMVPIGNAFNKFTRVVRDIGRQLGKDMELYVDGESTELDKTIVEQIGDPLIHLIRNSCDHGIEMPDVRQAAGKRRTGQIWLSARQEGNHIIIVIQDDGKGLPVDAIRKKALERGLITPEMVLSKRDVFNLIFEPGFSTAEKITNLSGRGVGMDVVRKQISKLKGLIDIDSELGKGTTTTIRLPLTLAIMQSLLIESAGETFAIPLSTVVESVRIKPEEVQMVGDAEVIKRHDRVLPLMYLHDVLDLGVKATTSWYSARPQTEDQSRLAAMRLARRKDRLYVVIVGTGDRRFGIVVDQLLTQQEMVIKSLGPVLRKVPCVAGGAVLGNGEVVLVIDIQELEDSFRTRTRSKAA